MKMRKIILLISILAFAFSIQAAGSSKKSKRSYVTAKDVHITVSPAAKQKAEDLYEETRKAYTQGKMTADQVVDKALYHKVWDPELAARCLQLVSDKNVRAKAELGYLYIYSKTSYLFPGKEAEAVSLMESAAKAGYKPANDYLGIYYNYKKDYDTAWKCFQAGGPDNIPFALMVIGEFYDKGHGVKKDRDKALEYYSRAANLGDRSGATNYGSALKYGWYGKVNMPDAFFWTYIAGDLGDDFSRSNLQLPLRGERFGDDANTAFMRNALTLGDAWNDQYGHAIQKEPIFQEGYRVGILSREDLAENGDPWSLFYLGSLSYNNEFLKRSDDFVQKCYQYIIDNKLNLPQPVLALVYERLGDIYRNSNEIKRDVTKAREYTRKAAQLGSLAAYKIVEKIPD